MKTKRYREIKGGENNVMTDREREDGIDRFIQQNVYACQSLLVDEALKGQWFSIQSSY